MGVVFAGLAAAVCPVRELRTHLDVEVPLAGSGRARLESLTGRPGGGHFASPGSTPRSVWNRVFSRSNACRHWASELWPSVVLLHSSAYCS